MRVEGGRTYLGRSATCHGIVTEGEAIHPDRGAEVRGQNRSAEGKIGHAVGKDIEGLQGRKAEQQLGRAGNGDRRPERYPARGIKGRASKRRDS